MTFLRKLRICWWVLVGTPFRCQLSEFEDEIVLTCVCSIRAGGRLA